MKASLSFPLLGAFAFVALACGLPACSAAREAAPKPSPSTNGHDDVAGRDNEEVVEPAAGPIAAGGNQRVRSFSEAKRTLTQIYDRHRTDLYCGCPFAPEKGHGLRVDLDACGYVVAKDAIRAKRIEWEHAVPASWFGKTFAEWTVGDDRCVTAKGKHFKGRKCAGRSPEFSRMEGDMHNLFPVVGEVNGLRSDLPIGLADPHHARATKDVFRFGACASVIEHGVFVPRPEARGDLARASLYMNSAYPDRHLLDDAQRALFEKWSAEDPPDSWERERNHAITDKQGNANPFIDAAQ